MELIVMDDSIVRNLLRDADIELWSRYKAAIANANGMASTGKGLLFPSYSNGTIRVSEKEARQLVIEQLQMHSVRYSVETPTVKKYCFTGLTPRSAITDLTIYSEGFQKLFNVEFKAGGRSLTQFDVKSITKDLEKLALEDVNGIWFHTLENGTETNVVSLWQTMLRELNSVLAKTKDQRTSKSLLIHISVLSSGCSASKLFQILADDTVLVDASAPMLSAQNQSTGGWKIHRQSSE